MRSEKRVWAKQRSVLVHNMTSLLKTAKVEISRKDGEIGRSSEHIATAVSLPQAPLHSKANATCGLDGNVRGTAQRVCAGKDLTDAKHAIESTKLYFPSFFVFCFRFVGGHTRVDSSSRSLTHLSNFNRFYNIRRVLHMIKSCISPSTPHSHSLPPPHPPPS